MTDATQATAPETTAPAPSPAPAGAAPSVLSGSAEGTAPASWSAGFEGDTKTWLDGMGVSALAEKDALAKIVPMYRSAEQKLGVPADQLIRAPKDANDTEAYRAAMTKLGLPETPDGYGLQAPEGDSGEFAKTAASWFHKHGIPKASATGLAAEWDQYVQAQQMAQEEKFSKAADADIAALKTEFGEDYSKNIELAKRVRRAAGLSDEEGISIERSLGVKRAAMVFAELGKSMGEARFVEAGGNATFGMSADAAKARIIELRKDSAWQASHLNGDADKAAEWARLHKVAYQE